MTSRGTWSQEPENARRATEAQAGPPFSPLCQVPAPPFLPHKGPDPEWEGAAWMPGPTSCRSSDLGPVKSPPHLTVPICQTEWTPALPRPALQCQVALPAPDAEDLLRVLLAVGRGGNDEQSVQQVDGDAMGTLVAGAPDPGKQGEGKAVRVMIPEPGSPFLLLGTPQPPQSTTAHSLCQIPLNLQHTVGVTSNCAAFPRLRQSCCRAWLVLAR